VELRSVADEPVRVEAEMVIGKSAMKNARAIEERRIAEEERKHIEIEARKKAEEDAQKRIEAAISLSSEERYHDLEKSYPEFLQRFPQHIIASYLGINRETLSRIRGRYSKK